jgi:7-cyano-7-deazaguanine synthase
MEQTKSAVLVSGGLDSAVLLAEMATLSSTVFPIYIQAVLPWEATELYHLQCFLKVVANPAIQPLQILSMPVSDLYGNHWSITGQNVPAASSPDEAVYLPGRNVLLLAKAMLWCHLHVVPSLALAVLSANPFPDATPEFFTAYAAAINQAVRGTVEVIRPFAALKKKDVLLRARGLPLELSFSCIHPQGLKHCGRCNKCDERRRAFRDAGMIDSTEYDGESACFA